LISFRKKLVAATTGCLLLSLAAGGISPFVQRWYSERHIPIGLRDFQQTKDLFDAHEYVAAAKLGRESLAKQLDDSYGPSVALQSWRACARLDDSSGMDEFRRVITEKYPNSSAAIDLSFEASCQEISQGRLTDAEKDLSSCLSKQSSGGSAPFAAMLSRFCTASNESQFH
jgi:hypothetical protein